MTIFVGNLSFKATEDDVREWFAEFGTVTQVKLPVDRETGRKRGFAFVDLDPEEAEQTAINEMDGATMLGRPLRVNKAQPRRPGEATSSQRANFSSY